MANVELLSYEIRRVNMFNNIQEDGAVQLKNNIKFDIKYGQDDESAVATLVNCMRHREHPGMFCIELQIRGNFRLSGIKNNDVKKQANVMCYKELVSCAHRITAYLARNSGMEGMRLKKSFITPQCVNFEVKPDDENSGKIIGFREDI